MEWHQFKPTLYCLKLKRAQRSHSTHPRFEWFLSFALFKKCISSFVYEIGKIRNYYQAIGTCCPILSSLTGSISSHLQKRETGAFPNPDSFIWRCHGLNWGNICPQNTELLLKTLNGTPSRISCLGS